MKKGMLKFLSIALTLVLFAGCNNAIKLDSEKASDSTGQDVAYGTLKVVNSDSSRALEISELEFAEVSVSGTGIKPGSVETVKANITGGTGSFKLEKVPVGKNRVVTVQAFDTSSAKMEGVRIRAIVDIEEGENTVTVNWASTALGNVFAYLEERGVDISAITESDLNAIKNAIDSSVHSSLINASGIAIDYDANGAAGLKTKDKYVLEGAILDFSYTQASSYNVQVTDPNSSITTCAFGQNSVKNIAPGVWKVIITDTNGTVLYTKPLNVFEAGKTLNLGSLDPVKNTDIVVHAKSPYKYIWYWATGQNGTLGELKDEGNGWYGWTFENTSAINIIFRPNGGEDWTGQTGNLSREECGEYWYYKDKWYTSNPEDTVKPTIVSFAADKIGSVSGAVTFTISASDNSGLKNAVIAYGANKNEQICDIELSGTSDTQQYKWNTATIKNGTYSVKCVVYDGAGNSVESQPISFTTSNENLPPVVTVSGPKKAAKDSEVAFRADAYDQNGGNIASYTWTVTGGNIVGDNTGSSIKVKMPSAVGSKVTVSVTVKDDEEASASHSTTVEVSEQTSGDFRDESIYFVMTTRFYDGDPSNNEYCWDEGGEYLAFGEGDCAWRGDFKGLAQKLDYIKALGFSAIWITPVVENASGIDYHGYHAYDFSKVDPRYESTGYTYQNFIDDCHAKGIKVIQDIVLNHSGNFGERNLFHMFDKDTVPYVNKDIALPAGSTVSTKRSPFMKLATDESYGAQALAKALGGKDYEAQKGSVQYGARIDAMKEDSIDTDFIYHHTKTIDWNSENCQLGQMAGDCVDLNTENPTVYNYLINCYNNYIDMGVDGFRIDTVKHISRLTFNKTFIPAFKERGGDDFYIFGETCARYRGRWNEGVPALSPSFYTWKETENFAWSDMDHSANSASATAHFSTYRGAFNPPHNGTPNHLLNGNEYHIPDWSKRSGLDQIDFPMHWAFSNAPDAFRTAVGTNDPDFNDATWNVVYVDSHDYAPDNAPEGQRYSKTEEWPRNMNLMFSFRGIPCIYYGSEVMFKAGKPIDPANVRTSLDKSGRAYFGDYLEGTVSASDYSEYTASGTVAETLSHPLAKHVTRLNKIRRAISALRKGQYSTKDCEGAISFKRRYTDENVDSFALVAIGGQATFSGVPSGKYIEVITGKEVSCTGSLTSDEIDQNNMRIYVLKTSTCEVTGKIGEDGEYLK